MFRDEIPRCTQDCCLGTTKEEDGGGGGGGEGGEEGKEVKGLIKPGGFVFRVCVPKPHITTTKAAC